MTRATAPEASGPWAPGERGLTQQLFVRVCRDSGFRLSVAQACHFTAKLRKTSPIAVWVALGFDNMERIANGTHPCLAPRASDRSRENG